MIRIPCYANEIFKIKCNQQEIDQNNYQIKWIFYYLIEIVMLYHISTHTNTLIQKKLKMEKEAKEKTKTKY